MNWVNTLFVESVLNDIGQDLFNGDEEVIAKFATDIVLSGKTFKDRIDPKQVFNPVFYS